MKLQFHPFSELFPMPPEHEIDELSRDIKKNGQRVPIVVYGGKILDGRCRYIACLKAGVDPKIIQFGKGDPKEYVTSMNLLRRHLSTSERARIAALMSIESPVGNPETAGSPVIAPNGAITQSEAAKTMGVSRRSVQRAKEKIQGKADAKRDHVGNGATDEAGVEIPQAALVYWNRKAEARNILNQISAARGQVKKLRSDDPMWSAVNLNGVIADLNNAFNRFSAAIPAYVCPYCKGTKPDNCKCCKGKGVVSKFTWSTIPCEIRESRTK